jgi:hypothetical protein
MYAQAMAVSDRIPGCRAMRQRIYNGETVIAATCGVRGSPFQLPARLADGLGLESDLGHGYPRPCAPSSNCFEEPGSPAPAFRKESRLRLLYITSHQFAPLAKIVNGYRNRFDASGSMRGKFFEVFAKGRFFDEHEQCLIFGGFRRGKC